MRTKGRFGTQSCSNGMTLRTNKQFDAQSTEKDTIKGRHNWQPFLLVFYCCIIVLSSSGFCTSRISIVVVSVAVACLL